MSYPPGHIFICMYLMWFTVQYVQALHFYQYLQAGNPDKAKTFSVFCAEVDRKKKKKKKTVEFCAIDLSMVKRVQQSCSWKLCEIHTSVSDYQLNINFIFSL